MEARRILIYGVSGSGKSTFAQQLSARTGLPCHLADELVFDQNWVQMSDEFQRVAIMKIVQGDQWILDTAYAKWIDIPLSRVDLIVGLDYPRWFSLQRLVCRTLRRIISREAVCNGNRETLRLALSRRSIILWHFQSFKRKQSRMHEWARERPAQTILFRSAPEAERWLASIKTALP